MQQLKLISIGNSVGVVLPKELLEKLRVSKGDTLSVTETPTGVQLSAFDERKSRQMEAARQIMRENRNLLKELAK